MRDSTKIHPVRNLLRSLSEISTQLGEIQERYDQLNDAQSHYERAAKEALRFAGISVFRIDIFVDGVVIYFNTGSDRDSRGHEYDAQLEALGFSNDYRDGGFYNAGTQYRRDYALDAFLDAMSALDFPAWYQPFDEVS